MEPTVVDMRELSPASDARARRVPRLSTFACELVQAVTARADEGIAYTLVRCHRRVARRPCTGCVSAQTLAGVDGAPTIAWSCTSCDDRGTVIGFRGTPWDLSASGPDGVSTASLTLTHEAFRWATVVAHGAPDCERLTHGARLGRTPAEGAVVLTGPAAWFDALRERVEAGLFARRTADALAGLSALLDELGPPTPPPWADRLAASPLSVWADIDHVGWALDDGEARHIAHPDSFWIPDLDVRLAAAPGSIVKLIFAIAGPDGDVGFERMWVVVEWALGDTFFGRLDNEPLTPGRLQPGHPIFFGPQHIIDVWKHDAPPV